MYQRYGQNNNRSKEKEVGQQTDNFHWYQLQRRIELTARKRHL